MMGRDITSNSLFSMYLQGEPREKEESSEEEEEEVAVPPPRRGLPPSDSDDEEVRSGGEEREKSAIAYVDGWKIILVRSCVSPSVCCCCCCCCFVQYEKKEPTFLGADGRWDLPNKGGNTSEEESSDSDDIDAELDAMMSRQTRRQVEETKVKSVVEQETGRNKAQMGAEMSKLAEIRAKREADRLKRIKVEGWDRFAPLTETNKPPGHGPVAK